MKINKHKIIWMVLAAAIVVVLLIMWLVGVSPRRQQIAEANAQTAQIEQQNKKLSDEIREISASQASTFSCRKTDSRKSSGRFRQPTTSPSSSPRSTRRPPTLA